MHRDVLVLPVPPTASALAAEDAASLPIDELTRPAALARIGGLRAAAADSAMALRGRGPAGRDAARLLSSARAAEYALAARGAAAASCATLALLGAAAALQRQADGRAADPARLR